MKCSTTDKTKTHVIAEGYDYCQCGKTTRAPIEYNYSPGGNIRVDPETGNVGIGSVKLVARSEFCSELSRHINNFLDVLAEQQAIQPILHVTPFVIERAIDEIQKAAT